MRYLITGPCQMESRDHTFKMIDLILEATYGFPFQVIYKSSFDKANRTSIASKRGVGLDESMLIFDEVCEKYPELKTLTDVHERDHVDYMASVGVDYVQIPAFLSRQTDLLVHAGSSNLGVNIKKGQFLSPHDMKYAVEKVKADRADWAKEIFVTERGTTFGYNNLVVDFRSLIIMKEIGVPVIFDATHSVQAPGGLGGASGGDRRFVVPLARAAAAVGVDGLFMEVHEDPDNAPSDGPNMLNVKHLRDVMNDLCEIAYSKGLQIDNE